MPAVPTGETAALAAAFAWAVAALLFRRLGPVFSPAVLNLAKGVIAIVLLLLTALWLQLPLPGVSPAALLWLLDERLPVTVLGAIGLTLTGVTWALPPSRREPAGGFLRGLGCGLLAALCQAIGAVLSR